MKIDNWLSEEKRKCDNGRLWYVCPNPLPTTKAYGRAIAQMCESFGKEMNVTLACPNTKYAHDLDVYYGTHSNFHIMAIPVFIKSKNQYLHFLKEYLFALTSFLWVKLNPVDIIYTRSELVAFVFAPFYKTIYEGHQVYPKMHKITRFLLRKCHKVIVLNRYLKRDFSKVYPEDKILIAGTGYNHSVPAYTLQKKWEKYTDKIFESIYYNRVN